MVGKEVVKLSYDTSILQQGAGENASLTPKGGFEPSPHLSLRRRAKDIGDGLVLAAGLVILCGALLLDCAVRSWRGEVAYPYGDADDTL